MKTRRDFENYLNEMYGNKFGTELRYKDNIQFEVLYIEWKRG